MTDICFLSLLFTPFTASLWSYPSGSDASSAFGTGLVIVEFCVILTPYLI